MSGPLPQASPPREKRKLMAELFFSFFRKAVINLHSFWEQVIKAMASKARAFVGCRCRHCFVTGDWAAGVLVRSQRKPTRRPREPTRPKNPNLSTLISLNSHFLSPSNLQQLCVARPQHRPMLKIGDDGVQTSEGYIWQLKTAAKDKDGWEASQGKSSMSSTFTRITFIIANKGRIAQNHVCRDAKRYVYRNVKFSQRQQFWNVRLHIYWLYSPRQTYNQPSSIPISLSESVRSRLIHSLDRWHFEPHRLPDEENLACTLLLFEALFRIEGMQEAVPLTMRQCSFSHIH